MLRSSITYSEERIDTAEYIDFLRRADLDLQ